MYINSSCPFQEAKFKAANFKTGKSFGIFFLLHLPSDISLVNYYPMGRGNENFVCGYLKCTK